MNIDGFSKEEAEQWRIRFEIQMGGDNPCVLDGIKHHQIDRSRYPPTYVEVPVELTGFPVEKAKMSAGIVGFRGLCFQPEDEGGGD